MATGSVPIHTSTTGPNYELRDQYDASIFLVDPQDGTTKEFTVGIIGADLACEGFVAIIGWDLLSKCVFHCDGPAGKFSLSWA
jgi:hypothetical protein